MATILSTPELEAFSKLKHQQTPMYSIMHGGNKVMMADAVLFMPSELPPTVMYTLKTKHSEIVLSGDSYIYMDSGGCQLLTPVKHLTNNSTTIPKVCIQVGENLLWEILDSVTPYPVTPKDKLMTLTIQANGLAVFVNGFIVR